MNPNEFESYPIPTGRPPVPYTSEAEGQTPSPKKKDVLSLLSLIFGLISGGSAILCGCFCFMGYALTLYLGIAALVLGIIALVRKTPRAKRAVPGVVAGGIGVVCSLVLVVFLVVFSISGPEGFFRWCSDTFGLPYDEMMESYEDIMESYGYDDPFLNDEDSFFYDDEYPYDEFDFSEELPL